MNRKFTYFPAFFLLIAVLWSCGSHRKNPIARVYHNTAAHFNYHYNGEVKMKEGVQTIFKNYQIPPEGYVPILVTGTEEDAKSSGSIFEEAQKKAEIGLLKHKNAKCKDDFRFLIGRAWFFRQNYILAQQNFEYILKEYPKSKLKPDVLLWLVKTHFRNDNMEKAKEMLAEELKNLELNKRQKGELTLIKAEMALKEKKYEEAADVLEENLEFIKGKDNKARVHFLLGQLYADQDKFTKSVEHFREVAKLNTEYEFIFKAKLRIARSYVDHQEGADETEQIQKMLKRMLRDFKNQEFRDQIYFEMALLELKKENLDGAVGHLKKSIATNTNNQRQRALSYYKIGQIFFYNKKDYRTAEAYFDSAATSITKTAPEYQEISTISATLKEYVGYLNTIEYQDSMVWLAGLDSMGLERQINKIIELEKQREAEKQQKLFEEMNLLDDPNMFNQSGNKPAAAFSSWPFESPDQVQQGRVDFQRIWGQRKNEDNWNRKNKELIIANAEDNSEPVDSGLVSKYGANRAKYYKDVPKTPEEVEKANNKIISAMYNLGQLYQNKLNQSDSAVAVFKRLIARYPQSDYALKAQYALYKIFQKEDPYLAEEYKKRICKNYPNSIYCKLCNNVPVTEELYKDLKDFQTAYNALYETYTKKDYKTCLRLSGFMTEQYFSNEDIAQVFYLKGLSFGKLNKRDSLKSTFRYIKQNFPDHEVTPVVIRTLELMEQEDRNDPKGNSKPTPKANPGDESNYEGFSPEQKAGENVYAVLLLDKNAITTPQLQIRLSTFNRNGFEGDSLKTSVYLYKEKQHLCYIGEFPNLKAAKAYSDALGKDAEIKALMKNPGDVALFITPENFRIAYGQKRFDDYIQYYQNVLLKTLNGN